MSTTSTTLSSASASATVARHADYERRLEGLDKSGIVKFYLYISANIAKEALKATRPKRQPKLDEEGNVIKRPLPGGAKVWNDYVAYVKTQLEEAFPDTKIHTKSCMRVGSILKDKGQALGEDNEQNTYYPIEKLTNESLMEVWEEWSSLPEEERFPKKEKASKKVSAASESEPEDSEEEVVKPKRGRPAKKQAVVADSEAEAEVEEVKPKAKGKAAKKQVAPVDSEAEEVKVAAPVKGKAAKKPAAPVDSEVETEPKPAKKAAKSAKKGE